jgi:hypothetical protein
VLGSDWEVESLTPGIPELDKGKPVFEGWVHARAFRAQIAA